MNKPARKHHYVPEFFLAGFTPSGSKDDFLQVLDQRHGKRWQAKPAEVAHQKDFYRVEAAQVEPDVLEKQFSEFEGRAATVIKQIIKTAILPKGDDFNTLISFIAFSAIRVPRVRKVFSDPMVKIAKMTMEMVLATPEHWQQTVDKARKDGIELKGSYEEMKKFFESGQYTIEVNQIWHLQTLFQSVNTIHPLLAKRNWMLLIAKQGGGEFICSDDPIGLVWTTNEVPPFFGPGFGMPDTEVTIPLNKDLALRGQFEGYSASRAEAGRGTIAAINSRTAIGARCLYSANENFVWIDKAEKVQDGGLLEMIQEANKRGEGQVEDEED